MDALMMVAVVELRRAASVGEPTRLMPPHSPGGSSAGQDWTKTDGQLGMLRLSRRLVNTLAPASPAFNAAPVRLIVPFDFTTLPPATTKVPLLRLRLPFRR